MNILFIAGGLEPGHDGVGDYTRHMAAACNSFGHKAYIIAINDSQIDCVTMGDFDGVKYIRVPSLLNWSNRWKYSKEFTSKINFEWVSLQFVPYAFNNYGLFTKFLNGISHLVDGKKLHLNFHEIWIGEYPKAPLKERLVGYFQKKLIKKLIHRLQPKSINYSNAGAQSRLKNAEICAHYLPIFSNIPVALEPEENWIIKRLLDVGRPLPDNRSDQFIFFGFFGTIHSKWPARQLLERLRMYTAAKSKRPALLHAGLSAKNRNRWKEMQRNYSGDWLIHSFGKLSDEDVSNYLNGLNFGLTSTPWDLLGKSGSVAAMVEHGLPVIVNVEGGTLDAPLILQEDFQRLILRADEQLLQKLPAMTRQFPKYGNLSGIAEKFICSLENS